VIAKVIVAKAPVVAKAVIAKVIVAKAPVVAKAVIAKVIVAKAPVVKAVVAKIPANEPPTKAAPKAKVAPKALRPGAPGEQAPVAKAVDPAAAQAILRRRREREEAQAKAEAMAVVAEPEVEPAAKQPRTEPFVAEIPEAAFAQPTPPKAFNAPLKFGLQEALEAQGFASQRVPVQSRGPPPWKGASKAVDVQTSKCSSQAPPPKGGFQLSTHSAPAVGSTARPSRPVAAAVVATPVAAVASAEDDLFQIDTSGEDAAIAQEAEFQSEAAADGEDDFFTVDTIGEEEVEAKHPDLDGTWKVMEGVTCVVSGCTVTFSNNQTYTIQQEGDTYVLNKWVFDAKTDEAIMWARGKKRVKWQRIPDAPATEEAVEVVEEETADVVVDAYADEGAAIVTEEAVVEEVVEEEIIYEEVVQVEEAEEAQEELAAEQVVLEAAMTYDADTYVVDEVYEDVVGEEAVVAEDSVEVPVAEAAVAEEVADDVVFYEDVGETVEDETAYVQEEVGMEQEQAMVEEYVFEEVVDETAGDAEAVQEYEEVVEAVAEVDDDGFFVDTGGEADIVVEEEMVVPQQTVRPALSSGRPRPGPYSGGRGRGF